MKKEKLINLLIKKINNIENIVNKNMKNDGDTCEESQRMCLISAIKQFTQNVN
jgi:hypothetical protein